MGEGLSTSFSKFKIIKPPSGSFFADPFVIKEKDKYFIFIEDYDKKLDKGNISFIEINKNGDYGKSIKIIDQKYHLSYPFIVNHKGSYYLIPESRANNTIEVYKCIDFPNKWKFLTNLMEDIEAVDTNIIYHENKWWLFTNIVQNKGASSLDELFLFFSDDLISKKWIPHPQNPIVSDVRRSRSAGKIFNYKGMLLRPSQDSSKRYGYGMKINQIKILNESDYKEIEVDGIYPNWSKNIIATHTINSAGDLTVIDGNIRNRVF